MLRAVTRAVVGVLFFAAMAGLAAAPAKDNGDPLRKDSRWKGRLTQKGKIEGTEVPLDLHAELTVTRRDGEKFEAKLKEWNDDSSIKLTYLVKGEITKAKDGKGYKLTFTSHDVEDAVSQTFLKIPYTGAIPGTTLEGTWKHPDNTNGTTINGDFNLKQVVAD
jgi:hypothetical protein